MRTTHDRRAEGCIGAALDEATTRLRTTQLSARLDAEVLLGCVLGRPRHWLHAFPEEPLGPVDAARFNDLVERRANGEPVAYLIGHREFWSIHLEVTPDTLIPRPDTECLVDIALARLPRDVERTVLDLGTGSGNLALSIAIERPRCRVTATDVSTPALVIARRNAEQLGISNVLFAAGDFFEAVTHTRFDLIVSNPPYVADADPCLRAGEVRYEPPLALQGGPDGLRALRHIIALAPRYLNRGGVLCLEHGFDQAPAVRAHLARYGYSDIRTHRDTGHRERVTEGAWEDGQSS